MGRAVAPDPEALQRITMRVAEAVGRATVAATGAGSLIRMRDMLEEIRNECHAMPPGGVSPERLGDMQRRTVAVVHEHLENAVRQEFDRLMISDGDGELSESELRLAQAQLTGWLDGFISGVQAAAAEEALRSPEALTEAESRRDGRHGQG